MTTACLPCEMAATAEAVGAAPEIDEDQRAEWSGPIGLEAQRTGDGRLIEANALRWDTLPIPLRWAMQDFGAHDGAYVVGKIESVERLDYEETNERLTATGRDPLPESFKDVVVVWGEGVHDMGSEYGREAHRQCKEGLTPGISMDLDDIVIREEDGEDFTIAEGRVRAATQVAIPAFEGARIAVSEARKEVFDADERLEDLALLSDAEAFNWVEDVGGLPEYVDRIKKHLEKKGMTESHAIATAVNVVKKMCATGDVNFPGAQQVNAGSRAEACAAVADWEAKKAEAHANSADDVLVASAGGWAPPREWFEDPRLDGPTGLTVDDDGRVYGHIALWGTCHIANPQGHGVCTQPPSSPSGYRNFHLGVTRTDEGDLATGKITMNTVHAGQRLSMVDTLHHYEHTGTVAAHVRAGEDAYGIWLAGAALPGTDLVALRAAPISGDWRSPSGALDMVAALSVNVPGFPVPRATALVAGGAVVSLVASGVYKAEEKTEAVQTLTLDDSTVLALRERFREMDRADKAAALAAKVARLAALERVRRVGVSLPPRRAARRRHGLLSLSSARRFKFAYNKDQWRVPKGNPEGGRWVDMPGVNVDHLADVMTDVFDRADIDEGTSDQIGQALDKAQDAAREASDALSKGNGDHATEKAAEATKSLQDLQATLGAAADDGSINADDANSLGEALNAALNSTMLVENSDLSLLGDEGIGGDEPDITKDTSVVGDAPEPPDDAPEPEDPDTAAPADAAEATDLQDASEKAMDDLNLTMESLAESIPDSTENTSAAVADVGKELANVQDAVDAADPTSATAALNAFESKMQDYIDTGDIDLSDEDANAVGEKIDALRSLVERMDPDGSAAEPLDVPDRFAPSGPAPEGFPDDWTEDKRAPFPTYYSDDGSVGVTSEVDGEWFPIVYDEEADEVFPMDDETGDPLPWESEDRVTYGTPQEALDRALGGDAAEPVNPDATAEDKDGDGKTGAEETRTSPWDGPEGQAGDPGNPAGSPSQQASKKAWGSTLDLEADLMDVFDSADVDPGMANQVGEAMDDFRDVMDRLNQGVQGGNASLADQDQAQAALSKLEAVLMAVADGPGLSDQQANQIGVRLDDAFENLGNLIAALNGPPSEPPPFSVRKYARQWLGRRGIVLARG